MTSLEVNFAGLRLKNPVIVASAPPTETVGNIVKCAEAGAGAVITKTCANFDPTNLTLGGRRTYIDGRGLWAQGTFRHETLTLEEGIKLVTQSVREIDIPVIASVGTLTLTPDDVLKTCLAMQDAGAKMIQLDLFYVPQPRCSPENISKLLRVIEALATKLTIPFAPKMNHDIPPHYAAQILKNVGLDAMFLIDSLRVPVPIDPNNNAKPRIKYLEGARECSLFGEWQKPLTLQYTSTIYHELGLPICAGGGLWDGADAIEAIMMGAKTVQFATVIIKHGFSQITKIIKQITHFMDRRGYTNLDEIQGLAHQHIKWDGTEVFTEAKAVVNHDLCVDCGLCTRVVFCQDIHLNEYGKVQIEETCDGCGLCPTVCPVPGALEVQTINTQGLDE